MSRCIAVVPAAGSGSRMGASQPKQYLPLLGEALLLHTLDALDACPEISLIALVLSPDDSGFAAAISPEACQQRYGERLRVLHCGGASRAETVRNGLAALAPELNEDDWLLVHDAARPCLSPADVSRLVASLADDPVGGLLALPVADTLKRADPDGRVAATVARDSLWRAQTPQMFRHQLLRRALAHGADSAITDEASAIEALGLAPRLVAGNERNLKVTYPDDLALAALFLRAARTSTTKEQQA